MTQRETNPYKFSDSNKRYQTYDYYTKHTFGGKCARIPLDAGFSCPNKDGTRGSHGCIFCLSGSSAAIGSDLHEQYDTAVEAACRKWNPVGYIPYLQANTNTYAPPHVLRRIYAEAASLPGAVMLGIATRADCLDDDVIAEISAVSEKIPVTVELGLQSASDATAERIGRGHTFEEFKEGYRRLRAAGGRISIGVHIINGLPGERCEDMFETAKKVARLAPDQVKIHLLTVLCGTRLEKLYERGEYVPMEREEYVNITCDQIELLPERTVIARVTGDAPQEVLIAPEWSRRKTEVTNMIDKELYRRGTYQGCRCEKTYEA
ncbi:MAG: TIGR01212 family radical SAM protein [Clostridiales bacterium]|nr:TIGR01212 family radical SAM protein [Clostridiales bacterium]